MRKIEREMNNAIRNRVEWSKDNTRVSISDAGNAHVLLHNNLIATVKKDKVLLFDGGWQTVTTKSRLNAILDGISYGCGVFQHRFNWFINTPRGGTEPFYDGFEIGF